MVDYLQQDQGSRPNNCAAGTNSCGGGEAASSPEDSDESGGESPDAGRFGVGLSLRAGNVWLEPLRLERPRSNRTHRDATCGPTRRRASPRAAACWDVLVPRGSRGLGLSLESAAPSWPGHVRVKRVFPHEPAAATGRISVGDLLLRVNEIPVRGLTVQEVLHVLRLAGTHVLLSLARAAAEGSDGVETDSEPEPGRDVSRSSSRNTLLSLDGDGAGTFEVELEKVNSSLGLSLRRTDDTVLGHTIRAKVREPALSDPRLRAGDKLLQVNGVDTTCMSHAEVVAYLRQSGDRVRLTLYRDGQATPASPGSPVTSRPTKLRPEALEMLCGLAFRRELSHPGSDAESPSEGRRLSAGSRTSPRIRRGRGTPGRDTHTGCDAAPLAALFRPASAPEGSGQLEATSQPQLTMETGAVTSPELSDGGPAAAEALSRISESSGGGDSDCWNGSGSDSDAELHERHLRRVADASATAAGPARGRQPYLSVQPQQRTKTGLSLKRISSEERLDGSAAPSGDGGDLLKWKGFTLDAGAEADPAGAQSLVIQLKRGWSARLGFSLHSIDGGHVVAQIHPDSVAARDGRLKIGDVLVKVNDTPVRGLSNEQVVDLLRKSAGAISLTVLRL